MAGTQTPFNLTLSHDDRLFATSTETPSPGMGLWELGSGQLVGLITHDELERVDWLSISDP